MMNPNPDWITPASLRADAVTFDRLAARGGPQAEDHRARAAACRKSAARLEAKEREDKPLPCTTGNPYGLTARELAAQRA